MSSIVGERQFGRHFKRQFGGEGNWESKIAARQWGVNEGPARHQDVSQGPLGTPRPRARGRPFFAELLQAWRP